MAILVAALDKLTWLTRLTFLAKQKELTGLTVVCCSRWTMIVQLLTKLTRLTKLTNLTNEWGMHRHAQSGCECRQLGRHHSRQWAS